MSGEIPPDHLEVRLNGVLAGRLWQRQRDLGFAYDADWLAAKRPQPISQSLPLQEEAHEGAGVEAFFGNLLPEGDVRAAVARALRISERNDYALLDAIGGDCAGALTLAAPGATPVEVLRGGVLLTTEELARLVEDLPRRPLLTGESGIRLSLAGAQLKLALCNAGDGWLKPAPGVASTHILKPPIRDLPDSVENEAFCMTLAERCALGVPKCWIEPAPKLYVVERYDRVRDPASGKVRRLHQEDFCQALGIPASRKYEAEGGPSLKACFDLVRRVSSDPAGDLLRLTDWVIFNFLIGNHDAHAKNLSLIYERGQTRLAPFYDLLSTAAYPQLSDTFAMKIGGARTVRYMSMNHWRQFAEECGLTLPHLMRRFSAVAAAIAKNIASMMDDFISHAEGIQKMTRVIEHRSKTFSRIVEAEKPQGKLPLG